MSLEKIDFIKLAKDIMKTPSTMTFEAVCELYEEDVSTLLFEQRYDGGVDTDAALTTILAWAAKDGITVTDEEKYDRLLTAWYRDLEL